MQLKSSTLMHKATIEELATKVEIERVVGEGEAEEVVEEDEVVAEGEARIEKSWSLRLYRSSCAMLQRKLG